MEKLWKIIVEKDWSPCPENFMQIIVCLSVCL